MKKYIIVSVMVLGLLFSFGQVKAATPYEACMADRNDILVKGWMYFAPEGTVEPVSPKIAFGTSLVDGNPAAKKYLAAKKVYDEEYAKYSAVRQAATNEQNDVLSAKLAECNAIKNTVQPGPISGVPNPDPAVILPIPIVTPVTPPTVNKDDSYEVINLKNTINSLVDQNTTLQKSNASLTGQVNTLNSQLKSAKSELDSASAQYAKIAAQLQKEVEARESNNCVSAEKVEKSNTEIMAPVTTDTAPVVETPAPVKKGFWGRIGNWFK